MSVQAQINKLWNSAAGEYDEAPRHGLRFPEEVAAWKGALAALLPPAPANVLDVGTGTGMLALLLAEMGYKVRGVDLAEGMLERAKSKASERGLSVSFEAGDAMDPGGEPESLDAIVSRHVFWTLTEPDRALRHWLGLLRPGGRLVIIDGIWAPGEDDHRLEFQDSLPMTKVSSIADLIAIVSAGGFVRVAQADLGEVPRVERDCFGATEEQRYVITASKSPNP